MKKLFLMLAIAGFLTNTYTQTLIVNDVPAAVTKAFKKSNSKVVTVQWRKVGDTYKAKYAVKMKDIAIAYRALVKWKETETEITVAALPTPVLKYINENYPAEKVKWSSELISARGKLLYAVKIKGMDLTFGSNGKIMIN